MSIGIPSTAEFDTNITSFLGPKGREAPNLSQHAGQVIVIDGVAIEEAIWFDFKCACLLGICHEHSKGIKMSVDDLHDIKNVANALYTEETCHHGKDATVLGLAPITSANNYHVTPLVLSPSCKSEKGDGLAEWIRRFIEHYHQHPYGEKVHGPIYTLATDDKQNVPKAVNLIQSLMDLRGLNISGTQSEREHIRSILFISDVLSHFLLPFIKVKMSLSEQLRHLSAYSHLITALYWRHGLEFMTSALLADSQAIMKNIIFTTARLQLMDPNMSYYILFEGTDHLENVFSHVRTQDHARNFDIQQLSYKLSIATEIDAIFQRHPDLNRGHLRRNLVNTLGVDHINPKSWLGNVRVRDVNIQLEYLAGRAEANKLLLKHFHSNISATVNFNARFSEKGGDHLRPNGEYIGSRGANSQDDSEEEDSVVIEPLSGNTDSDPRDEDENNFEDAHTTINTDDFNGLDIQDKDLLNPPAHKSNAHYLIVDNKKQYILTLVSSLLGADRERKALITTWPLRAQGITLEQALQKNQLLNSSGDDLDVAESKIKAGDLGVILAHVGDQICLVVIEALNFRQGTLKTNLAVVDVKSLDANGAKATTVAFQVLRLVAQNEDSLDKLTWWWPQDYIQVLDSNGKPVLQCHLVIRISGKRFHPLSPEIIYSSADEPLLIWSLNHHDLEWALAQAWSDLDSHSDNIAETIKSLPEILGPDSNKLPYQLLENSDHLMLYVPKEDIHVPLQTVKLSGEDRRPCHLCGQIFRINDMRNHVGMHILKAHQDVIDLSLLGGLEVRNLLF
ncbi:hypothetical protein BDZ97DRAFT_1759454 [Flammula alnicola]|nr:hypothetical protein BDZ97DRAFT_1759454 [Flammula alnicola]